MKFIDLIDKKTKLDSLFSYLTSHLRIIIDFTLFILISMKRRRKTVSRFQRYSKHEKGILELTGRRDHSLFACSCSSNIRLRCSVKPVVIEVLFLDVSSLTLPYVVVSNVFFNSPTRPDVGRSIRSYCVRDAEEYFGV
jgi:hypothetical protein